MSNSLDRSILLSPENSLNTFWTDYLQKGEYYVYSIQSYQFLNTLHRVWILILKVAANSVDDLTDFSFTCFFTFLFNLYYFMYSFYLFTYLFIYLIYLLILFYVILFISYNCLKAVGLSQGFFSCIGHNGPIVTL